MPPKRKKKETLMERLFRENKGGLVQRGPAPKPQPIPSGPKPPRKGETVLEAAKRRGQIQLLKSRRRKK